MPSVRVNRRLRTVDAIERNAIHQSLATASSRFAIDRCKSAVLNDPVQAIEVLRALLQPSINEEVKKVLQKFSDAYFNPAINNARANLGDEMVPKALLEDVCVSALEHAKLMFKGLANEAPYDGVAKEPVLGRRTDETATSQSAMHRIKRKKQKKKKKSCDVESKPNTDIILLTKSGKPVRREGEKWMDDRLTPETLFILGSRANKALGFGQTRGRLYIKHPELFKYSGDQEDKEWLAKSQLMSTTGGKAYLMALSDVLELAQAPDYVSHPRQQLSDLTGFTVPAFMLRKMRAFMTRARTDPETPDDLVIPRLKEQMAQWEDDRKRMASGHGEDAVGSGADQKLKFLPSKAESESSMAHDHDDEEEEVDQLLDEMKPEDCNATGSEDELGFLHGMNLNNLVRELEAATAGGAQTLGILSLADDEAESAFQFPDPEPDEEEEPMLQEHQLAEEQSSE